MNSISQTYHCSDENETAGLAQLVAGTVAGGQYISLEGDLGAGKTFFSRHLLEALGVSGPITSPTYVIQKIYPLEHPMQEIQQVVHYDFYRIGHPDELIELGFEDHDEHTLVLAEWGNLHIDSFPCAPVRIQIGIEPEDKRAIEILRPSGPETCDQQAD